MVNDLRRLVDGFVASAKQAQHGPGGAKLVTQFRKSVRDAVKCSSLKLNAELLQSALQTLPPDGHPVGHGCILCASIPSACCSLDVKWWFRLRSEARLPLSGT